MRAAETRDPPMDLDGFLAFLAERPDGERWELDDGVPLMNPQPTRRHDWIQTNILEALRQHWRVHASPWRPSGPSQVPVPGRASTVAPDVLVALDDGRDDLCITPAPLVVFEVLSPSDRPRRQAAKLAATTAVPSIASVVLVRQDRRAVTVHHRNPDGGLSAADCTDVLDLPEIGVTLTLDTIYDDTPLAR
ncbi:Uma2 family endonuclease [Methylobacterium nonmethylotrophicum]|uniref:Uma2 family endonuclease n=1 Tax=Methylobacterium nonmethylotrophicum TaxID=1141884 RepID=A0A4Z0NVL7_9HYPH|nr:Uma2 family endonuclease [Methylobacterium nonmethylotrophicum]TGE01763.1 Uma2 family endonuclease [Methylobacterium nonmethylotrophicum]